MLLRGTCGVNRVLIWAATLMSVCLFVLFANAQFSSAHAAIGCVPSTLESNVGTFAFGRPDDQACNTDTSTPTGISVNHVQASQSSLNTCPNAGLGAVAPCIVARTVDNGGNFTPTSQFCTNPTNNISVITSVSPLNAEAFGGLYLSGDGACDYRAIWTFDGLTYQMTGTATRTGTLLQLTNLQISGGLFEGSDGLDSQAASLTPLIMNHSATSISEAVKQTLVKRLQNRGQDHRADLEGFYVSNPLGDGALEHHWHGWVKGQGTYFDGRNNVVDGYVIDILAGADRAIGDDAILGVLAGIGRAEFDSLMGGQQGQFDADGWHLGLYGGVALADDVLIDMFIAYTKSQYDNAQSGVTGRFDAQRWTAGMNVSGSFVAGDFIITPSLAALLAHEQQQAYVDSLGAQHEARDVTTGKISAGPKIARPFKTGDVYLVPWLHALAELDVSNQQVGDATGLPDIDGMVSARVSSGLQAQLPGGAGLGISGHVAGLGTDQFVSYGGEAIVSVPF